MKKIVTPTKISVSAKNQLAGLVRRPDIEYRQLGMDAALYDPGTGVLHMLNAAAAAVWNHITEDRTTQNIAEVLAISFDMYAPDDVKRITLEVEYVLSQFRRARLLVKNGESVPPPITIKGDSARYIPDYEITSISKGYIRPSFKSFTLAELKDIFESGVQHPAPFADTWKPTTAHILKK